MIKYDYKTEGIRQLTDTLKSVDPKLYANFRKNLKMTAVEIAGLIQTQLNGVIVPLSGMKPITPMQRNLRFAGVITKVQVPTRFNKKGVSSLVNIIVSTPPGAPGFLAIEKAGARGPAGQSGSGQAANLIAVMTDKFGVLRGSGKRQQRGLSWAAFYRHKLVLVQAAMKIVEQTENELSDRMSA
jgi:hypothetical protein